MTYAVQSDMLTTYGSAELVQLTDIELPHTGAVVGSVLDDALQRASDEIDGYLLGRYTLPLAPIPAVLREKCCLMAHYKLMTTSADERSKADYDAAIRYLERVASGAINLIAPADVPQPAGIGTVSFATGSKVFGRECSDDCGNAPPDCDW